MTMQTPRCAHTVVGRSSVLVATSTSVTSSVRWAVRYMGKEMYLGAPGAVRVERWRH